MAKGSQFERDICRELSLWWTAGESDAVFWRTPTSGARATTRSKAGKSTANQYGDVIATDPIGQPLLDALTIELKRGYNKATIHDLLDTPATGAVQTYGNFIRQAQIAHTESRSFGWLLIHRRDRRSAWAWMPSYVFKGLEIKHRVRFKVDLKINSNRIVSDVVIGGVSLEVILADKGLPERIKVLTQTRKGTK